MLIIHKCDDNKTHVGYRGDPLRGTSTNTLTKPLLHAELISLSHRDSAK
jgi:hypothetical protein